MQKQAIFFLPRALKPTSFHRDMEAGLWEPFVNSKLSFYSIQIGYGWSRLIGLRMNTVTKTTLINKSSF